MRRAVDNRVLIFAASVPERLRLEFLIGVQDAMDGELKFNAWGDLTRLVARLARMGVESVLEVQQVPIRTTGAEMLLKRIQWSAERTLVDPEAELARDVWRLGLLRRDGARQNLDLTTITQPWLRELFRDWARESLGTVRNVVYLNGTLCQIRRLSESLRTRPDSGNDMTAVGRRDIEQFLMRLAGMASAGKIAKVTHVDCVTMVRCLLRRARDRGLTAAGGPLHGLPDTFAVYESDSPQREERDPDDEVGRSLPNSVIKQLASNDALAFLAELSNQDVADVVELLIRTGRRPTEICHLTEHCLQWDERVREDGTLDRQPVLVYRPEKTPKRSKRLPVHAREALIIKRARDRTCARFPDVAAGKLPLFPQQTQNRSGKVPLGSAKITHAVRGWARGLPELLDSDGTPYDRERVYAYAFRHSYAQRLADKGCSPHLLMEIMDHRSFQTTEGYCRIRQERRREAVDPVLRWQWDAEGNELELIIERFAESEDIRIAIGSTAIPYGSCVEPSNVAALGSACPYVSSCIGLGLASAIRCLRGAVQRVNECGGRTAHARTGTRSSRDVLRRKVCVRPLANPEAWQEEQLMCPGSADGHAMVGAAMARGVPLPVVRPPVEPSVYRQLFDRETLADYLRLSTDTIDRLVKANKLACVRIGSQVRFTLEDVDAFLERNRTDHRSAAR